MMEEVVLLQRLWKNILLGLVADTIPDQPDCCDCILKQIYHLSSNVCLILYFTSTTVVSFKGKLIIESP